MQDYKDTNEEDSATTVEEVEVAVQKLKNYKAPGKDNIPAELFRYGGKELVKGKDANRMECEYNLPHT